MNNTLDYIRSIEEVRGKYLHNYFNAGRIDAIFSEVSKVRKQIPDGKVKNNACNWCLVVI